MTEKKAIKRGSLYHKVISLILSPFWSTVSACCPPSLGSHSQLCKLLVTLCHINCSKHCKEDRLNDWKSSWLHLFTALFIKLVLINICNLLPYFLFKRTCDQNPSLIKAEYNFAFNNKMSSSPNFVWFLCKKIYDVTSFAKKEKRYLQGHIINVVTNSHHHQESHYQII